MSEFAEARAGLLRLRSELVRDRQILTALGREIDANRAVLAAETVERSKLAVLAVDIHRYYTGLESILERIERYFGVLPTGPDWHRELLDGAALEIEGVRPRVLAPALLEDFRELLRFRHFFRHAYAVELNAAKLEVVVQSIGAVRYETDECLRNFESFLTEAAGALDG